MLSTALAALAVAASMLPRFAAGRSARFARLAEGCGSRLPLLPPAVAVAAWVAMQMGFSGYYGWAWDRVALAETGRFSPQLALTALDWRGIAELRADPMYELLAIYKLERRGYLTSLVLNAHARKAAFNSASFMGFSRAPTRERLAEALKRLVVVDSMLAALNGGRPVSEADRQFMIARKVRLLVPEEAAAAFGSATRAKHGRFVVLELR